MLGMGRSRANGLTGIAIVLTPVPVAAFIRAVAAAAVDDVEDVRRKLASFVSNLFFSPCNVDGLLLVATDGVKSSSASSVGEILLTVSLVVILRPCWLMGAGAAVLDFTTVSFSTVAGAGVPTSPSIDDFAADACVAVDKSAAGCCAVLVAVSFTDNVWCKW
jgi:hypothetical protein